MDIASFGFDTVKAKYLLGEPLPTNDRNFMLDMLEMGWEPKIRQHPAATYDGSMQQSTVYFHQAEGATLRYNVINAGREVLAEYSVPRYRDSSYLNFVLAEPEEVRASLNNVARELQSRLPLRCVPRFERLLRLDAAVDIFAKEAKPGLIKAAKNFKIPKAKKQNVKTVNSETTYIQSPSATFRVYDKGSEALAKTRKLSLSKDEEAQVNVAKRLGRVRMEYVFGQRGGFVLEALDTFMSKYADTLEQGFGGSELVIGGLDHIGQQLDTLETNEMTRAKLYMFVVRCTRLGLEGTRKLMGKTAYYDALKKTREHGLQIDDSNQYEGKISLRPVFGTLRASELRKHTPLAA